MNDGREGATARLPTGEPAVSTAAPWRRVQVSAASRLHFGLFSTGRSPGRQFGGVGLMIEKTAVQLQIESGTACAVAGPLAERVREFVGRWAEFHGGVGNLPCRIVVQEAADCHVGLGVGTQLGLAVAAGLNVFLQQPPASPLELALSVGRGHRSAVGTYGFASGGLIVERGKLGPEPLGPLEIRLEVPPQWRFVLLQPRAPRGLSGQAEQEAFRHLPPVPPEVTARLIAEVRERMVPAVASADCEAFGESVYAYGRLAGDCFAPVQGGPYNGPQLAALVDLIRAQGVRGVGQSSWGPTLFAILPHASDAQAFVACLADRAECRDIRFAIHGPANHGARVTCARDAVFEGEGTGS